MDFNFPGSGGTLTRMVTANYSELSSHMQQERRVMGSSTLTRDYNTLVSGHGECGVHCGFSLSSTFRALLGTQQAGAQSSFWPTLRELGGRGIHSSDS